MSFRGIFAIPPTPFADDGALDVDSLRRCVELCCLGGAHGVVTPVNASEFPFLTDEERRTVVETAVRVADGRLPVVAGVAAPSRLQAVGFARHAQASGADAVIAMPPYVHKCPDGDAVFAFYQALDNAVTIPIFIQNHPFATAMEAPLLAHLVTQLEHVSYIKEETRYAGKVMSQTMAQAGEALAGVMGGMAGKYLISEFDRGACGNMPACETVEIHAGLWELLEAGERDAAQARFTRLLPLLNFEASLGVVAYKAVLHWRGVIRSPVVRQPASRRLDAHEVGELDRLLTSLADLLTVEL